MTDGNEMHDPSVQFPVVTDGLRPKYHVHTSVTGEPVHPCFVLRYDRDSHARVALLAYADSCEVDNPVLARDLRNEVAAFNQGEQRGA